MECAKNLERCEGADAKSKRAKQELTTRPNGQNKMQNSRRAREKRGRADWENATIANYRRRQCIRRVWTATGRDEIKADGGDNNWEDGREIGEEETEQSRQNARARRGLGERRTGQG